MKVKSLGAVSDFSFYPMDSVPLCLPSMDFQAKYRLGCFFPPGTAHLRKVLKEHRPLTSQGICDCEYVSLRLAVTPPTWEGASISCRCSSSISMGGMTFTGSCHQQVRSCISFLILTALPPLLPSSSSFPKASPSSLLWKRNRSSTSSAITKQV